MRWIALLITLAAFTALTGVVYKASAKGWGLPGLLE